MNIILFHFTVFNTHENIWFCWQYNERIQMFNSLHQKEISSLYCIQKPWKYFICGYSIMKSLKQMKKQIQTNLSNKKSNTTSQSNKIFQTMKACNHSKYLFILCSAKFYKVWAMRFGVLEHTSNEIIVCFNNLQTQNNDFIGRMLKHTKPHRQNLIKPY